jgi:hypothetical protein
MQSPSNKAFICMDAIVRRKDVQNKHAQLKHIT